MLDNLLRFEEFICVNKNIYGGMINLILVCWKLVIWNFMLDKFMLLF